MRLRAWGAVALGLLLPGLAPAAAAPGAPQDAAAPAASRSSTPPAAPFLKTTSVGDVLRADSPAAGPLHFDGALSLYTADYFRGRYGGVPASLDRLSWRLATNLTLEVIESSDGLSWPRGLSVTAGLLNALTDAPAPGEDIWYTNDRFVGFGLDLGGGVLAGATYTAYKNPYSPPGVLQDVALTFAYSGDGLGFLQPRVKAVKAVGAGSGWVVEGVVTPAFKPGWAGPITFSAPITVGVGFDGYFRGGVERGWFVETGAVASAPLGLGSPGAWSISGGGYLTLRSESIAGGAPRFDDAGRVVPTAFVSLTFIY